MSWSSSVETVNREAWSIVTSRLTLAELGSSGSSCWTVGVSVVGRLRPNPSASSPSRSTVALKVTSNEPVPSAVVSSTEVGFTVAPPTVTLNGVWKSSPCHPTWWRTIACRPS